MRAVLSLLSQPNKNKDEDEEDFQFVSAEIQVSIRLYNPSRGQHLAPYNKAWIMSQVKKAPANVSTHLQNPLCGQCLSYHHSLRTKALSIVRQRFGSVYVPRIHRAAST